jgi:hypothetical protein
VRREKFSLALLQSAIPSCIIFSLSDPGPYVHSGASILAVPAGMYFATITEAPLAVIGAAAVFLPLYVFIPKLLREAREVDAGAVIEVFGKNEHARSVFWTLFLGHTCLVLARIADPVTAQKAPGSRTPVSVAVLRQDSDVPVGSVIHPDRGDGGEPPRLTFLHENQSKTHIIPEKIIHYIVADPDLSLPEVFGSLICMLICLSAYAYILLTLAPDCTGLAARTAGAQSCELGTGIYLLGGALIAITLQSGYTICTYLFPEWTKESPF